MSLNVKICPLCGKMHKGTDVCPECAKRLDKAYTTVRDYLYKHANTDIKVLSEETEVDEKLILHLIKTKRIDLLPGANTGFYCTSCGKPLAIGRMCEACSKKMSQTLSNIIPDSVKEQLNPKKREDIPRGKEGSRMFTADRRKDK